MDPLVVQSGEWVAAVRPDGQEPGFAESFHAIRRTGLGFQPKEMQQRFLCLTGDGYRECREDEPGAQQAWLVTI